MTCELPIEQHRYSLARIAVLKQGQLCSQCGTNKKVQVHHIRPVFTYPGHPESRKKPSKDVGCWNHHDNLEPLCKTHHQQLHQKRRRWSAAAWLRATAKINPASDSKVTAGSISRF